MSTFPTRPITSPSRLGYPRYADPNLCAQFLADLESMPSAMDMPQSIARSRTLSGDACAVFPPASAGGPGSAPSIGHHEYYMFGSSPSLALQSASGSQTYIPHSSTRLQHTSAETCCIPYEQQGYRRAYESCWPQTASPVNILPNSPSSRSFTSHVDSLHALGSPSTASDYDSEAVDANSESEYGSSPHALSSPLVPLTQHHTCTDPHLRRSSSSSEASCSSGSSPGSQNKRQKSHPLSRRRVAPRSEQVAPGTPFPKLTSMQCPFCKHFQRNGRMPDLSKHVRTHFAKDAWFCCGLPIAEAESQRPGISSYGDARYWPETGKVMAGGCGTSFKRLDAYRRHLHNPEGVCIGDSSAEWFPGNARENEA